MSTLKYTNIIQFLAYAAIMASMIFIPVLAADELNASKFEIGIIFAGYALAVFLSSSEFADDKERAFSPLRNLI